MTITPQTLAVNDVNISAITSTATKIPNNLKITDLLTGGGFNLINFIFTIIGLVFFANLIMAGWDFMFSSGDPKKVSAASTRIINGLIGLVMAVIAFVVVKLLTNVIGIGNPF